MDRSIRSPSTTYQVVGWISIAVGVILMIVAAVVALVTIVGGGMIAAMSTDSGATTPAIVIMAFAIGIPGVIAIVGFAIVLLGGTGVVYGLYKKPPRPA